MRPKREFTIDKVAWHTQTPGNTEPPEKTRRRLRLMAEFLQQNRLTARQLLAPGEEPNEEFGIHTSDLTDLGCMVMMKGYDKWLRAVDRGRDPADMTIMIRALSGARRNH